MAKQDEAVLVTDQIGRIRFANAAACELLGYSQEELLKLLLRDTYPPDQVAQSEERPAPPACGGDAPRPSSAACGGGITPRSWRRSGGRSWMTGGCG